MWSPNVKYRDYYLLLNPKPWCDKIITPEKLYETKINELEVCSCTKEEVLECFRNDTTLTNPKISIVAAYILSDILQHYFHYSKLDILSTQELFQKDLDHYRTSKFYDYRDLIESLRGKPVIYTNAVKYCLQFIKELPVYSYVSYLNTDTLPYNLWGSFDSLYIGR